MWGPGGRFCFQRRLQHPLCSSSVWGCHPSIGGRFESSPLHLRLWPWECRSVTSQMGLWKCCAPLPPSMSTYKEPCGERERDPANPRRQPPQGQVLQCQPQGSQPTNPSWNRTTHLNPALDPELQDFAQIKWWLLSEATKSGWIVTQWNSQWPDVAGVSAARQ